MNTRPRSLKVPYLTHELVNDRIQTLHREAEEQRLVSHLRRVQRARRRVQRANERLHRVMAQEI